MSAPPKKSRRLLWAGVAVAVVVAVSGVALLVLSAVIVVDVTAVRIASLDNACGTNGDVLPGFRLGGGESIHEALGVTNGNRSAACTISSVTTTTPGFHTPGANTPLTISPGETQNLSFLVRLPTGAFTGVLTVDFE
ncbi:MAG: hypothetical protein WBF81_08030 [Thermoplasmata archaeon]